MLPLMVPGWLGVAVTATARTCGVEAPHPLSAVTVILPLLLPAVAVMLAEELVPLHPPGKVQV